MRLAKPANAQPCDLYCLQLRIEDIFVAVAQTGKAKVVNNHIAEHVTVRLDLLRDCSAKQLIVLSEYLD